MGKDIASILADKDFQSCTAVEGVPTAPGVFILADCPLTETNPSKWTCSFINAGESETNMQEKISFLITANNVPVEYKNLTYFTWVEKQTYRRQDVLQEIIRDRKLDNEKP